MFRLVTSFFAQEVDMKIIIGFICVSLLGFFLAGCTEEVITPIVAKPYSGEKTISFKVIAKNAGIAEITEAVEVQGTAVYHMVNTSPDVRPLSEPATYDVHMKVEAEAQGMVTESKRCCVSCQSCDGVCVYQGSRTKFCKNYPVPGVGQGVYLFMEFNVGERELTFSRAWLAYK
jgi:hypothetical protein